MPGIWEADGVGNGVTSKVQEPGFTLCIYFTFLCKEGVKIDGSGLVWLPLRCEQEKSFALKQINKWEENTVSNNNSGKVFVG